MTTSSKTLKKLREAFEGYECTGFRCEHETSEKHYIVFDGDIEQLYLKAYQEGKADYFKARQKTMEEIRKQAYSEGASDKVEEIVKLVDGMFCVYPDGGMHDFEDEEELISRTKLLKLLSQLKQK